MQKEQAAGGISLVEEQVAAAQLVVLRGQFGLVGFGIVSGERDFVSASSLMVWVHLLRYQMSRHRNHCLTRCSRAVEHARGCWLGCDGQTGSRLRCHPHHEPPAWEAQVYAQVCVSLVRLKHFAHD